MEQDIHNNPGKSCLSKIKEERKDKVSLYEQKSSHLTELFNRQHRLKIKSAHMLKFLAVLASIFFVLYNL